MMSMDCFIAMCVGLHFQPINLCPFLSKKAIVVLAVRVLSLSFCVRIFRVTSP